MDRVKGVSSSLPIAVCFFDKNGMVRLVNHRMLTALNHLRKNRSADACGAAKRPASASRRRSLPESAAWHLPFSGRRALRFVQEANHDAGGESDIRNSPPQTSRN